jgi:hypothetical protein
MGYARTACPYSSSNKLKKENKMADCCDMKEGDIFYCDVCGLELSVAKACTCTPGSDSNTCTVPLQCCGQEMKKR